MICGLIASLVPVLASASTPAAVDLPPGATDWEAARFLSPIAGSSAPSPRLVEDDGAQLVCGEAGCVAKTTRPELVATVEPDVDGEYHYEVFHLGGPGGLTQTATNATTTENPWTPALQLQHGHSYAWTVAGDDVQDLQTFIVDVEQIAHQPIDDVGPFSVGAVTGYLALGAGIGPADLGIEYRSSDVAGRATGTTPFHVLSDGWTIGGPLLGDAPWYAIEVFADGGSVLLHSVDGSSLLFEETTDGMYVVAIAEEHGSFMHPALVAQPDGTWRVHDPTGGTSTFDLGGYLSDYRRPSTSGDPGAALEVEWSAGLLRSVHDPIQQKTATFTYLGERAAPRDPTGAFDRGASETRLAAVTTFDGEQTEFYYLDGNLARIVGTGGAVADLAYDDNGNVVAHRDPLVADAVANMSCDTVDDADWCVLDDASTWWHIAYDHAGRVASITSPSPLPGAPGTVRSYDYGTDTTAFRTNGIETNRVGFDPVDLRPLSATSAAADASAINLYDEELRLVGVIDERGLQTSWRVDDGMTTVWGPAPAHWFDDDHLPRPEHVGVIATETTLFESTGGPLAVFRSDLTTHSPVAAKQLVYSGQLAELPDAVDPTGGWSMSVVGETALDIDGESTWRLRTDDAAAATSKLAVNGHAGSADESIVIPAPEEGEDDSSLPVELWIEYRSTETPSPAAPATFAVDYSVDGGETWTELDVSDVEFDRLESETVFTDVYAPGAPPIDTAITTTYRDPLLGLVGTTEVAGHVEHIEYEAEDYLAGRPARPITITNPAGVTTTIGYWGVDEAPLHPVTGAQLPPQGGREKSVQVGDDRSRGMYYDSIGRPIIETIDGHPTREISYDTRGRIDEVIEYEDGTITSSTTTVHGAGGDPRVTASIDEIDGERRVSITRIDLLGRPIETTDVWGTTTTIVYDDDGNAIETTSTTPSGATTTTTTEYDKSRWRLASTSTTLVDGSTARAEIETYDAAGRPTSIGLVVDGAAGASTYAAAIGYDAVTGADAAVTWTADSGHSWSDTLTLSSHTARILAHDYSFPGGTASYEYEYTVGSGELANAALTSTGTGPDAMAWSYEHANGVRLSKRTETADSIVNLDYGYDPLLAPTAVTKTTSGPGGVPMGEPTNLELIYDEGMLVGYDGARFEYDTHGALRSATDGSISHSLTRTADGAHVKTEVNTGYEITTWYHSGPFILDADGNPTSQSLSLPGSAFLSIDLIGETRTLSFASLTGDMWFAVDAETGEPSNPAFYSPDGELLDPIGAQQSADDPMSTLGWRAAYGGTVVALDDPIIVFGARAYLPSLGLFTTTDPTANAGPTPYSYADNDPVNLVDPTGNSSQKWWEWNSPVMEILITVAVFALVTVAVVTGQVWAAKLLLVGLASYYAALAGDAFANDDIVGGIFYVVAAVLTLSSVYTVHKAAAAQRAYRLKYANAYPENYQVSRTLGAKSTQRISFQTKRPAPTAVMKNGKQVLGKKGNPMYSTANYSKSPTSTTQKAFQKMPLTKSEKNLLAKGGTPKWMEGDTSRIVSGTRTGKVYDYAKAYPELHAQAHQITRAQLSPMRMRVYGWSLATGGLWAANGAWLGVNGYAR